MLCLFILALAAAGSWAAVSASVDRHRLALGDTLRLTITATDDEELGDLNLQPLTENFEILQRSSSSKTSYHQRQLLQSEDLLLDITPRRQGALRYPPLRVGAEATNGLPVTVGATSERRDGDQSLVFEAELDRELGVRAGPGDPDAAGAAGHQPGRPQHHRAGTR